MSTETKELIDICEQLPAAKRTEVTDFARFLLAREGDVRWETIVGTPASCPKFDAFLEESAKEAAEPLDTGRL